MSADRFVLAIARRKSRQLWRALAISSGFVRFEMSGSKRDARSDNNTSCCGRVVLAACAALVALPLLLALPSHAQQPAGTTAPSKLATVPAPQANAMNRLSAFPVSAPAEQRRRALAPLVDVITRKAPGLDAEERAAAVPLLISDGDPIVRERLWQLLANSPRYEAAIALAQQVLGDPRYVPRWSAFQYLREVEPQIAETLAQRPLVQPDARLLYVVADFIRLKDRQRGLALMIDALPVVGTDHEIGEEISLALAREGGEGELAELRRRDGAAAGRTTYRLAAELLATELARKSGPPKRSSQ
jgi:hypothetical protein